jgi:uncharacterized LabA/DUF88 family protein
MIAPLRKRVIAFFDGQNLFRSMKDASWTTHPDFDPLALALAVVASQPGWDLTEVKFYTGMPSASESPFWNHYWVSKLAQMGTRGIKTTTRPLRYQRKAVKGSAGGPPVMATVGMEKGIDCRIALDCMRAAMDNTADVILIFSQDQDLAEVALEVRSISKSQDRWIKIASAFPENREARRGVMHTDWLPFDKATYLRCLDSQDHRPASRIEGSPSTED